jgi:hypothetical protein
VFARRSQTSQKTADIILDHSTHHFGHRRAPWKTQSTRSTETTLQISRRRCSGG